jgi:hypothetical protein
LINSFIVHDGDRVQLGSRLSEMKFNHNKNLFDVFAPVPLLYVTVEERGRKADAFRSNIPYAQVIKSTYFAKPQSSVVPCNSVAVGW